MSSEKVVRDWTCEKCGGEWVNVITFVPTPAGKASTGVVNIACPKCKASAAVLGMANHNIANVDTTAK